MKRFITKIRRLTVKRFAQFLVFLLFADFGVKAVVFLVICFSKKAGPDFAWATFATLKIFSLWMIDIHIFLLIIWRGEKAWLAF